MNSSTRRSLHVLVINEDPGLRTSLATGIDAWFRTSAITSVVTAVEDTSEALPLLRRSHGGVALVERIDDARTLLAGLSTARVVLLAESSSPDLLAEALSMHVSGFLTAEESSETIATALARVELGEEPVLSSEPIEALIAT